LADLIIKNGKIVDHRGIYNAAIVIKDGKIENIVSESNLPSANKIIDAHGNLVMPGIIDPHQHLGGISPLDDDILTETRSAAAGGVTTVISLLRRRYKETGEVPIGPYLPKKDRLREIVNTKASVDTTFNAGIEDDEQIGEISRYVREMGLTSFKFTKGYRPHFADDRLLYIGMNAIRDLGPPSMMMVHCENLDIVEYLREKLIEEGRSDLAAYTEAAPGFVEAEVMNRMMYFSMITRCPLYIPHVTIEEGVEMAARYRSMGVPVITESCPHYLTFTKDSQFGPLGMINPPLRDKSDQAALWLGIKNGIIDCMGSDHVPNKKAQKTVMFEGTARSWQGVATILPVMLSEGVNKSRISLERLVEVCSFNPAKAFGLYPAKGVMQIGSDADFVIVDLHKKVKVTPEILHSASDYTLYDGWTMEGWPVMTILRGNIVMENGEIVASPGTGQYVHRMLDSDKAEISKRESNG